MTVTAVTRKANESQFDLTVDGLSSKELRVTAMTGREMISGLFHFSCEVETKTNIPPSGGSPSAEAIVGKPATLVIWSTGFERTITGVISRFEFLGLGREDLREVFQYSVELVPAFYFLTQQRRCHIFQTKTVEKILQETLKNGGIEASSFKIDLSDKANKELEYCVQYRETDFHFLSRMTEQFGIFYFHNYAKSNSPVLITDDAGSFVPMPEGDSLVFDESIGAFLNPDQLRAFRLTRSIRPTKHTVRDFNFRNPGSDLTKSYEGKSAENLEWYDYPASYADGNGGAYFAQVRQEAEECARVNGSAETVNIRLFPGARFTLKKHPISGYNGEYVITSVQHTGSQSRLQSATGASGYQNSITFQPLAIPYRAQLVCRKPSVEGSQTAIVTGGDGDEIFTDQFGRVKVRFHWDRSGAAGDKSSVCIRVAQLNAGGAWGGMFIPRIGHEVVVNFLEGDPDQPVIVGSLYNGANSVPYPLPDKKTTSTFKSESSLGGGGFNEIRFDDTKGSEEVFLHSQKDLLIRTLNNKNQSTGSNETATIGNNRTLKIGNDEQKKVGANETISIGADQSVSIGGNESLSVSGNQTESVSGSRTGSVGKSEAVSIGTSQTIDVGENQTVSVGKDRSVNIGQDENVNVGKKQTIAVSKDHSLEIGEDSNQSISKNFSLKVGKNWSVSVDDSISISSDKDISIVCGDAKISMKKNGEISISGKDINVKGSGNVSIKGSKVANN